MKSGSTNWQPARAKRKSQGLCGASLYRNNAPISSGRLDTPGLRNVRSGWMGTIPMLPGAVNASSRLQAGFKQH